MVAARAPRLVAAPANGATNGHSASATNGHAQSSVDRRAVLLEVVSQLTGYPLETLALEMDMEADLGIDSIKRVEILSMVSKRIPGSPSVNPEKLAKLRTLEQVLRFASAEEPPAVGSARSLQNGPATIAVRRR